MSDTVRKTQKKSIDFDESRRRRTETTVQNRKGKKDEVLSTRRAPAPVIIEQEDVDPYEQLFENQQSCNLLGLDGKMNIILKDINKNNKNTNPIALDSYISQQGAFCTKSDNEIICISSFLEQQGLSVRVVTVMWPKENKVPSFVRSIIDKYNEQGFNPSIPICVGQNLLSLLHKDQTFIKKSSSGQIINPNEPIPHLLSLNVFTIFSQMQTNEYGQLEVTENVTKKYITDNINALLFATPFLPNGGSRSKTKKTRRPRRKPNKRRKTRGKRR